MNILQTLENILAILSRVSRADSLLFLPAKRREIYAKKSDYSKINRLVLSSSLTPSPFCEVGRGSLSPPRFASFSESWKHFTTEYTEHTESSAGWKRVRATCPQCCSVAGGKSAEDAEVLIIGKSPPAEGCPQGGVGERFPRSGKMIRVHSCDCLSRWSLLSHSSSLCLRRSRSASFLNHLVHKFSRVAKPLSCVSRANFPAVCACPP